MAHGGGFQNGKGPAAPIRLGLLFTRANATATQSYAVARSAEHLAAIPGAVLRGRWVMEGAGPELPWAAKAWDALDSRLARLGRHGFPGEARQVATLEDLPAELDCDLVFVHSAEPGALEACARRAALGAFEIRVGGRALAAAPEAAWREVLAREPFIGLEVCFLARGRKAEVCFGPWQVRTHRTSPSATLKELVDAGALYLELAIRAFADGRRPLPAPSQIIESSAGSMSSLAGRLMSQLALRKIESRIRHSRVANGQWGIGMIQGSDGPLGLARPPAVTRWYAPGPRHFWADPFLVEDRGKTYLLYEELPFASWRGHLCAAEVRTDGSGLLEPRRILERPFHLSFPFCFHHGGGIYLLPEQAQSGRIQAYRARNFPFEWEEGPVVLPGFPGIDSVLQEHEGRWWLFTTSAKAGCHDNHLMLFHAPGPFGPFEPHRMNPVRMGLDGSRMGGAIIAHQGKLLRPGQDCSRVYGGALRFFEIEALNPDEYREREVHRLEPDPASRFPLALHTWSPSGRFAAIDGMRDLPRFGARGGQERAS